MTPEVLANCLYFGCWNPQNLGHFLFTPTGTKIRNTQGSDFRNRYHLPVRADRLDGLFCHSTRQSQALLVNLGPWTFIAMSDYSADSRPGSQAIFLIPATNLDLTTAWNYARRAFPEQVQRICAVQEIYL